LPRLAIVNDLKIARFGSPAFASTLTTSAPRSARITLASGPATNAPQSTTLTPSSGRSLPGAFLATSAGVVRYRNGSPTWRVPSAFLTSTPLRSICASLQHSPGASTGSAGSPSAQIASSSSLLSFFATCSASRSKSPKKFFAPAPGCGMLTSVGLTVGSSISSALYMPYFDPGAPMTRWI